MQINRLIEMVYLLLDKKMITARELSEHFEVSQRTIYRDVDALCAAGIPIYTNKGRGGGICLLENFVLNKSILSEREQVEILSSLEGLKSLNMQDVEPVLNKLAATFGKSNTGWIDVDFSRWGSDPGERERFLVFKTAILNHKMVSFDYYGANGKKTDRTVEPLKLVFKGYAWYVYAFCHLKNDFRVFKVSRIKNLMMKQESFTRNIPDNHIAEPQTDHSNLVRILMKVNSRLAFRVFDELGSGVIEENPDGSLNVTVELPDEEWIYGYLVSFCGDAEVIGPERIRNGMKKRLAEWLNNYS